MGQTAAWMWDGQGSWGAEASDLRRPAAPVIPFRPRTGSGHGPRPSVPDEKTPSPRTGALLGVLLVLGILMGLWVLGAGTAAVGEPSLETVTVRSGQSLWTIAEAHPVPTLDLRDSVAWIRDHNHLPDSTLMAGQELEVPRGTEATPRD